MRSLSSQVADAEREAKAREALVDGWCEWLASMRWDFWATGTWTHPVSGHTAIHTVERWLGKLAAADAYAVVGTQRGPNADKLHAHVLIGGVGRRPLVETLLRRSWVRSGHMRIEPYRPACGNAIRYLARQAQEIELIGSPKTYRPRRRGSRGSGANK